MCGTCLDFPAGSFLALCRRTDFGLFRGDGLAFFRTCLARLLLGAELQDVEKVFVAKQLGTLLQSAPLFLRILQLLRDSEPFGADVCLLFFSVVRCSAGSNWCLGRQEAHPWLQLRRPSLWQRRRRPQLSRQSQGRPHWQPLQLWEMLLPHIPRSGKP